MFLYVLAVAVGNVLIGFALGIWIHGYNPLCPWRREALPEGAATIAEGHGQNRSPHPEQPVSTSMKAGPAGKSAESGSLTAAVAPHNIQGSESSATSPRDLGNAKKPRSAAATISHEEFREELTRVEGLANRLKSNQDRKLAAIVVQKLKDLTQRQLSTWKKGLEGMQSNPAEDDSSGLIQMIAQAESTLQNLESIDNNDTFDDAMTAVHKELTLLRRVNEFLVHVQ